ncbi:aromatic-ring-hydroxylating dioxygenase subunit beta [Emcibacter nanhaiensis]|uniref:Aromatic-ring-hydroxylating dioxygenase subunit beta n=1 Tax=Emcibacter nanhaiensis TaxID=1505037 RepID=A0A501PTE1_9PROT|nr:aromatic-ring-hydroxylating dioxygenase subunit beta [Emcibacter nanhaiensis]TPD63790.1 hypothetical protein FIV46_00205 [Emcibacter nanhaiensis]
MNDHQPVSMEVHHEIQQFLYKEARFLDDEMMREWLTDMVDPEIRYQLVVRDERFRKDKSPDREREVYLFDDDFTILDLRVKQFETGLQYMNDPAQRMIRVVSNVEAFHRDSDGEFEVHSYGIASRFRRQYEGERSVFRRKDVLRRADDGTLKLLSRRIELGERVVRNKNLLFFL